MKHLAAISEQELAGCLKRYGEPLFRTKQINSWIFEKWVSSIEEMKNLPAHLRKKLSEDFRYADSEVINTETSGDTTEKILISLADGECIENVIIRTPERTTFCLSSQVGCPVQCHFCASGKDGLIRNLEAGEIIDHLLICCRRAGKRPDNIVFMGIGEPLINFSNITTALETISSPSCFALSPRRITVSTSGWVPGIRQLAKLAKPYNLALSLHGTNDSTRARLIPDKYRYPLAEILDACLDYREKTGRMITFEYTLIKKVNDSLTAAAELANLAKKYHAKVNVIPFNHVDGSGFECPDTKDTADFFKILSDRKVQATCRIKKGDTISAACGQLRAGRRNRQND